MSAIEEDEDKEVAQAVLSTRLVNGTCPEPGAVYRHYKGGVYSVVCVSVQEDTLELLVTYHSNKMKTNGTRTLDDFAAEVEILSGGKLIRVPRFARLAD